MKINKTLFKSILLELIDENPLACQGILSIFAIEYTDRIPTLAVSLEEPPRLMVNLDFLQEQAKREIDVKAVLLHEFLHVLLNHTEGFKKMDYATNVALDAIINHIIHRSMGEEYSVFFRRYYRKSKGYESLLRPTLSSKSYDIQDGFSELRQSLLTGRIVVDDLLELAQDIRVKTGLINAGLSGDKHFLGDHTKREMGEISQKIRETFDNTLKSYNGFGIYRSPKSRGFGAAPYAERFVAKDEDLVRWEHSTWKILLELCSPDSHSVHKKRVDRDVMMPVLNETDRRGFLKSLWSPLMLDTSWNMPYQKPKETTVVYLDVSGSMYGEMQALVHLLSRLSAYIQKPLWAFSDEVAPAVIRNSILETQTSGGTSMNAVLEHFADSDVDRAVVITDGYIEVCDPVLLSRMKKRRLFAVISRDGSPAEVLRAGIPYYQLEKYPGGGPS